MERVTLLLRDAQTGHTQFTELWKAIKANLIAGHRVIVEARQETRSDPANRLLHATLTEISKQLEWAGKKRDVETWKRLLMAAWLRARGESVELLPAIDGYGVDVVFRRTSKLTRAECSEFQEFVFAWGSEAGIKFPVLG